MYPRTLDPLTTPPVRRIGYGCGRLGTIATNASATLEASTRILPEQLGVEVVEEQTFYQGSAAPYSHLVERVREVLLDGVLGDVERPGDLPCGSTLHDEVHDRPLALAQPVCGDSQPRQLLGPRRLDDDHRLARAAGSWLGLCAVEGEPAARTRLDPNGGHPVRVSVRLGPERLAQRTEDHPHRSREPFALQPAVFEVAEIPQPSFRGFGVLDH